jgi:hypothetical protein
MLKFEANKKIYSLIQYELIHPIDDEKDFNNKKCLSNYGYLFHGSILENWYSIMRNGIKIASNTALMTNGAVYGKGIYLSDSLEYSLNYSGQNYSENNDFQTINKSMNHGSYIVSVYEVLNIDKYKKTDNIFVVDDVNALKLRFLIILERNIPYIKDLSHHLTNRFINRGDSIIHQIDKDILRRKRRIDNEFKKICSKYINFKERSFVQNDELEWTLFLQDSYNTPVSPKWVGETCDMTSEIDVDSMRRNQSPPLLSIHNVELKIVFTEEYPNKQPAIILLNKIENNDQLIIGEKLKNWKQTSKISDIIDETIDIIKNYDFHNYKKISNYEFQRIVNDFKLSIKNYNI